MPKMKTNSSAKKRFTLTGSGRVKRGCANHTHRLRRKSRKAKLRNRGTKLVHKSEENRVKLLLGIGG